MEEKNDKYIKHYIDGVYTQDEAQQVLNKIKEPELDECVDECMQDVWNESASLSSPSDREISQFKEEAYYLLQAERRKYIVFSRKSLKRAISIAASVAIFISIAIGGYKFWSSASEKEQLYTEQTTSFGETKTITLPDGTKVTLNSRTHISFPEKFEDKERRIILEGEAYFEVAKDEKKPFIINTEKFDIKVLGTEFNVRAYKGDIIQSVNVEGGKVQVDMPEATVRLVASEQIDINAETDDYSKYKEQDAMAVWRQGNLRFNKTPIRDVANELERVYDVRITFENGQKFDNLITGEHTNTSLASVLKTLTLTSNIQFKYDEKKKEILLYK